ncbi:hypothetical protein AB835_00125 [Candidatus Endobugula sertula]|uniref:Large ribosomal RNA subunit accumulation protein YceD n=1 Tax=Candidatus Endobugula sertula TaxID=62101 RepID=A0A1D2QU44_9GAMM|nr:hypothetical protein AB835_00125 [Candidatus Endobugula sertula]
MLNTPSRNSLPRRIDPRKFAQQGIIITGLVELALLPRVCSALCSDEGEIQASLEFGLNEQRLLCLCGQITASLQQQCQRCLAPAPLSLSCELQLVMVWDEETAINIPKIYDPWVVGEGQTDIYQVLEDELLLSLPIVSYHEEECVPKEYFSSKDKCVDKVVSHRQQGNPFQVLEQLKGALLTPNLTSRDEK